MWMRNSEAHPCELAAYKAALRAATEGDDPVPDYDNKTMTGIPPQRFDADVPTDSEQATALNNGITPITTVNGEARIVRSITSYCISGSNPDYRTLDVGDASFPDYACDDLRLMWETDFGPPTNTWGRIPRAMPWSPRAAWRIRTSGIRRSTRASKSGFATIGLRTPLKIRPSPHTTRRPNASRARSPSW